METTTDLTALVKKAQKDREAFAQLYAQTVSFSYAVARRYLSNPQDIEDVLQSSYMYAAKSLADLRNPEGFQSWLRTIVIHECQKCLQTNKKTSDLFRRSKKLAAETDEQTEWMDLLEQHERYELVRGVMDSLPNDQRMCAALFYYEEMTILEIAELLHVPQGTVKSRLYHARKKLEKELKKLSRKDRVFVGVPPIMLLRSFFRHSEAETAPMALRKSVWSSLFTHGAGSAVTAGLGSAAVSSGAGISTAIKATVITLSVATAVGGGLTAREVIQQRRNQPTQAAAVTVAQPDNQTESISQIETTGSRSVSTTAARQSVPGLSSTAAPKEESAALSVTTTASAQESVRQPGTTVPSTTTQSTPRQTTVSQSTPAATAPATQQPTAATTARAPATQAPTQAATTASASYQMTGGVLRSYEGSESSVSIPSSVDGQTVTAIGSGAFAQNKSLRSVQIPETVTQIGQQAFSDCSSLQSVSLPSSLNSIGAGAFDGCVSLTDVTVPNGVQSIGDDAFSGCRSLTQITVPSSVNHIGDGAFDGCDDLTIRCAEGSAAHSYAVTNGISYQLAEGL